VLTKALINNQCTFLENQMDIGVDNFQKGSLLLKMVPQIVKRLPLELIGVQPLSSPVGIIYKFDKRESIEDPLNIVSAAIEAYTRKLQSKWTIEAIQDLSSSSRYGFDFEQEMVSALAAEIAEEITTEIIKNLTKLAEPYSVVLTDVDDKKERMRKLVNSISDAATLMHARNMRKSANWIVVDPTQFVKIRNGAELIDQKKKEDFPECDAKPTFVGSPNVDYNDDRPLQYVGTLSGSIRVYVSLHMAESKNMLMGYSGTNPSDNGFFYCPYIMLMTPGVIVDPITFQPSMHLMTRYGAHVPDNASDYYTLLEIEE